MSLKELTKDNHARAESTAFMQAVFKGTLPLESWADFTAKKFFIYNAIESVAKSAGLLEGLEGIERGNLLIADYQAMTGSVPVSDPIINEYVSYIINLYNDPDRIMAHLYTWHMGDLFGGQMIKEIIPAPHRALDFENADQLKNTIRTKLNDAMADEANVAFEWAIRILETYDSQLDI
jgi:heme oxygenase